MDTAQTTGVLHSPLLKQTKWLNQQVKPGLIHDINQEFVYFSVTKIVRFRFWADEENFEAFYRKHLCLSNSFMTKWWLPMVTSLWDVVTRAANHTYLYFYWLCF